MIKYLNLIFILIIWSNRLHAQFSDYPTKSKLVTISDGPKLVRFYLNELKLSTTFIFNIKDTVFKNILYKDKELNATIILKDNYGSCKVILSNGDRMEFTGSQKVYRLIPITIVDGLGNVTIKKIKEYLPKRNIYR